MMPSVLKMRSDFKSCVVYSSLKFTKMNTQDCRIHESPQKRMLFSGELHSASCQLMGGFYIEPFRFHIPYKVKCIDNVPLQKIKK